MAELCKQIVLTVQDDVGKLAALTHTVNAAGVNIVALCAWVEGETAHLVVIVDDNDKAFEAMRGSVDSCEYDEAVCVTTDNRPGMLNKLAGKLAAAGIGIHRVYSAPGKANQATIIFSTSDNARAVEIL